MLQVGVQVLGPQGEVIREGKIEQSRTGSYESVAVISRRRLLQLSGSGRHDIGWVDELPVGKLVDRLSTSMGTGYLTRPSRRASTTCSEVELGNPNAVVALNYTTMVLTACRE